MNMLFYNDEYSNWAITNTDGSTFSPGVDQLWRDLVLEEGLSAAGVMKVKSVVESLLGYKCNGDWFAQECHELGTGVTNKVCAYTTIDSFITNRTKFDNDLRGYQAQLQVGKL